jgi:hypothetical protein
MTFNNLFFMRDDLTIFLIKKLIFYNLRNRLIENDEYFLYQLNSNFEIIKNIKPINVSSEELIFYKNKIFNNIDDIKNYLNDDIYLTSYINDILIEC